MTIFAETYFGQEVLAQSVDATYYDTHSFGVAFWNDAAEEIHLSLVAVDENGENVDVKLICFAAKIRKSPYHLAHKSTVYPEGYAT